MSPAIWLIAMTFPIHLITTWRFSTERCTHTLHTFTHKTDALVGFHALRTACTVTANFARRSVVCVCVFCVAPLSERPHNPCLSNCFH